MKIKVLLTFMLFCTLTIFGQGHKEKWEKIKALKVSFITTEVGLTPEESAKFWPVYNVYEEKQFKLKRLKMHGIIKKIDEQGMDKLTEKEALSYLDQLEAAEKELSELKQKLVTDLKPIIGAKKILKLKKAEDDFNKQLLQKYRDKKDKG